MLAKGHPAKAMVSASKSEKVDIVIVGSRRCTGAKRLLPGSVSSKTAHDSNVVVMVVR